MEKILLNESQKLFIESFKHILETSGGKKDMSLEKIKYYQYSEELNSLFIKTELTNPTSVDIGWFCLLDDASVYDLLDRFPESEDLEWFIDQLTRVEISECFEMSETKKLKLVRNYAKAWNNKDFDSLKEIITEKMKFYSQFSFYDFKTCDEYVNFLKQNIKSKLEKCITETQIGYYNGDPCLVIVHQFKEAQPVNLLKAKKGDEGYSFENKMSKRDSWVILFEFKDNKITGIKNCCVPTEQDVMEYAKYN